MTDKKEAREITFKDITKLNIQIWDAEREIQSLKKLIVTAKTWVQCSSGLEWIDSEDMKEIEKWLEDTKDIK